MMMPISHRLFASALAAGASTRKRSSPSRRPLIIDVDRKEVAPVWINGLTPAAQRSASGDGWLEGALRSE